MDSSQHRADLTHIQREVIQEFFAREQDFFLTGGAALAGYYLHHRATNDVDLFTMRDDAFERARHTLGEVAAVLGASLEIRQDAPSFLRAALTRGDDVVVVDLVRERVPQLHEDKSRYGDVRVDPLDEILVNKLTAVLGRLEERDLIDLYFLERSGLRVEDALDAALDKDGGCTPGQLAWVLSQVEIPDGIELAGGVEPAELRGYRDELVRRLRRAAMPPA